jgi:Cu+-exporting ATPase
VCVQVAEAKVQLAGAWALAALCVGSHLGHHLHHLGLHQYAHSDLLTLAGAPWVC